MSAPEETPGQASLFPAGEDGPPAEPDPRCETCSFPRSRHPRTYAFTTGEPGTRVLTCPSPTPEISARLGFKQLADDLRLATGIEPEIWNTGGYVMCLALPLERGEVSGQVTRYALFSELGQLGDVAFYYYDHRGTQQEQEGVEFHYRDGEPGDPGETWSDHPQLCAEVSQWAKPLIAKLKGLDS